MEKRKEAVVCVLQDKEHETTCEAKFWYKFHQELNLNFNPDPGSPHRVKNSEKVKEKKNADFSERGLVQRLLVWRSF